MFSHSYLTSKSRSKATDLLQLATDKESLEQQWTEKLDLVKTPAEINWYSRHPRTAPSSLLKL